MLVRVNFRVFESGDEAVMRNLDRLLSLWEDRQHEWILEQDVEALLDTRWVQGLNDRHRSLFAEIAKKSFVRSANIPKPEKAARGVIEIDIEGDNDIRKVISTLDAPLYLVVENETSDKLFLKKLFHLYRRSGSILLGALEKGHLEFYPSGGRNETIKTMKNLQDKKAKPFRARIFVFVDSDKKHPNQENSEFLQEIVAFCQSEHYRCHVTHKREIENYLPKEVLSSQLPGELAEQLEEIFSMTPDQWDFFDMEKGFNSNNPDENGLYSEFSGRKNPRYLKLSKGLVSKEYKPKQELFKLFNDDLFNEQTIKGRCRHQNDPDELLNLVNSINFSL